ncbi:hypothetical protein [Actinoalloteichus hymeniacidonis]|uniref:Uncharacterized protein n=1 Tax=Actinoalloteichus hymeniacidonis TaxID=340345 RepID=A0AAC9HMM6_9PSEU|nr:hypothetical protein [Actinoalloteichus hymeniacidonis]AOS62048.1 hypothetical protein TL08_06115 [Actinoalloteichus hymeniacidonis]MBB5909930.1 hypothetical protein [Actinoalloteichus hymeniacidonis]
MTMKLEMVLLAGFFQGPLFYDDPMDGLWTSHTADEAGEDLGLSSALVADLTAWDDEFQAIYDGNYPPDSHFPSLEAEQAWVERGKELAARIKQESDLVTSVDYQADGQINDGECVI